MSSSKLLTEISSRHVATFTLNRAEIGNACDAETLMLLADALERADTDASVRVIVLRGAGRHFCSGADVRAAQSGDGKPSGMTFPALCRLLDGVSKPTVAVVQGGCIGGGVAIAACCDVVLGADDAFFAVPEVRLGMAPGPLALYFMRGLGVRSLRRYLLTGERFTARVAEEHGLIHAVYAMATLDAALNEIVDALLLGAPGALGRAKATLARYGSMPMTDATFNEMQASFEKHVGDDEAQEGRTSFREKRKPDWYPVAKD